jgi:hypothetical protein
MAQLSKHPVNIRKATTCLKNDESANRAIPRGAFSCEPSVKDEELARKSLRIAGDIRFKEMKHYADSASNGRNHFHRVMLGRGRLAELTKEEMPPDDPASHDVTRREAFALQDREDWESSFEKSINRLLVDLDLTHDPQARLNHLSRMHDWFVEHGAKQQRKAQAGPAYLIADRNSEMPPGSTKRLGCKRVGQSFVLVGTHSLSGAARPHTDGSLTAR